MARHGVVRFARHSDGASLVTMAGDIDAHAVEQVAVTAIKAHHQPGRAFVVDASAVTFLDSTGLSLLARLYNLEGRLRWQGRLPRQVRSTHRHVRTIAGVRRVTIEELVDPLNGLVAFRTQPREVSRWCAKARAEYP